MDKTEEKLREIDKLSKERKTAMFRYNGENGFVAEDMKEGFSFETDGKYIIKATGIFRSEQRPLSSEKYPILLGIVADLCYINNLPYRLMR